MRVQQLSALVGAVRSWSDEDVERLLVLLRAGPDVTWCCVQKLGEAFDEAARQRAVRELECDQGKVIDLNLVKARRSET